ncbi:MAG: hypothetical protein QHG94_03125 [Candidatus Methanosuratincola sp.]|nr:hypothetical protein [Candidatus Methanosuratincola sp.]
MNGKARHRIGLSLYMVQASPSSNEHTKRPPLKDFLVVLQPLSALAPRRPSSLSLSITSSEQHRVHLAHLNFVEGVRNFSSAIFNWIHTKAEKAIISIAGKGKMWWEVPDSERDPRKGQH